MLVGNPNGAKDKGYYEKNEWVFNITKSAIHDINRIVDQENPNNPFLYPRVNIYRVNVVLSAKI